jgi:hypothetical protein
MATPSSKDTGKRAERHAGGRPPKPLGKARTNRISFFLDDEQLASLKAAADKDFDDVNSFARRMTLKAIAERLAAAAAAPMDGENKPE